MDNENATEEFVDNGPSADDLAALTAIDAIGNEFAPLFAAEGEEDDGDEVGTEEVDGEESAEANAPQPEPTADENDRGIERIVARELDLRQKEDAFKSRESKVAEYEAKVADYEKQISEYSGKMEAYGRLATTPLQAMKDAGHDPDQVMRLYLAEKLTAQGKPVPPELQQMIDKASSDARVQRLEAQIQHRDQMREAEQFAARIENGVREYVKGEIKNAPIVAELAKANPDYIYSEILDEIARDAKARAGKDNGDVLSYADAVTRVEKRFTHYKKLLSPAPAASTQATETKSTKVATPGASSPPKNPPKPLNAPKVKSEEELLNEAIKVGVSEFTRSEAARKRPVK